jgi:hypothetical protein
MNATITALAVTLAGTFGIAATEACQKPELQRVTAPEIVLTGCVVQGSSPTIFIFDNAKKDPRDANEQGERYLFVSAVENFDFRAHLNHQVRVIGELDMRVSAMPQRDVTFERTLQRFIVKTVTMVSDKCPSGK